MKHRRNRLPEMLLTALGFLGLVALVVFAASGQPKPAIDSRKPPPAGSTAAQPSNPPSSRPAAPGGAAKSTANRSPTSEEMRLVREWWQENEPNPKSVEEIRWEAGTMKNPRWGGQRLIRVKLRHENPFGGKTVNEQVFSLHPSGEFEYHDTYAGKVFYVGFESMIE